jgi:RNA polymerase sigma factor (sigma-70 family)
MALVLLETAGPRLHALLWRLTLRLDIAEDLMQELFINLDRSPGFIAADDPLAYARRAAVNLALNWRRSQSRRIDRSELSCQIPALNEPALAGLIQHEQVDRVLDAMAHLSDTMRQVVVLHYFQQEPYDAIASTMGKTEHQVRALCSKAIQQLRHALGQVPEASDA